MKAAYFILSVCFALFMAIESKDTVKKYTEKLTNRSTINEACKNSSGINLEFLETSNKMDEKPRTVEMKDIENKIGCYLACLMSEQGIMNDTALNTQKLIDAVKMGFIDSSEETPQDKVDMVTNLIRDCGKKVENMTNVCTIGWEFASCIEDIVTL